MRMPFRLAIRTEGKMVNAYLAASESMDGAELIGSLRITIARGDQGVFERWKALMQNALAHIIEIETGLAPDFVEEPVPEHERAGEA